MRDTIADSLPTNVLEQKKLFLADPTYNPQFTYNRTFTEHELTRWGTPRKDLYDYCVQRLAELPPLEKGVTKEIVTTEEILAGISEFNTSYKLERPIEVIFSENLITRCKVTASAIYFQTPVYYTREQYIDLLRHELETHVLRRLNHNKQPWGPADFPDEIIRRTEEGFASLHTYIFRDNKNIRKTCYTYIATYLAQEHSFVEIFKVMKGYGLHTNTAWNITTKAKRGILDTSQPGGATKNVCYLEGIIEVWHWLMNRDNDPRTLYWGRIGISQIPSLSGKVRTEGLQYPRFLENRELYYEQLTKIGAVNKLDTLTV